MGKIYSLENAYSNSFFLMALGGGWQIETKAKWKKRIYYLYSFFILGNLYSLNVTEVIMTYKSSGNIHDLTETLCIGILGLCTQMKHLIIILKASKIKEINRELENNLSCYKFSTGDTKEQGRLNHARKIMIFLFKFFSAIVVPCYGFQMAYPMLEEPERRRFPVPYWLPFDIKRTPFYEIIYSYLCIMGAIFMFIVVGVDTLLYGILVRINSQFEILQLQFGKLREYLTDETVDNYGFHGVIDKKAYVRKTLRQNFRYHQAILRTADKMMHVFSWSLFVHMTAATVLICIVLVDLMKSEDNRVTLQKLQRVPFCGSILFDTWLFCLMGTWIEDQSLKLCQEVYKLPWFDLDVSTRRELLFFMRKTQRAPQIVAGHTIPLNLKYFLSLLNASYSFYSVVRKTMN